MSKIKLSKIEHRGETRIKVAMPKQSDLILKIKSISGRRWSKTKNCWHLPYSKKSFEALRNVFGESNLNYPKQSNPSGNKQPQFVGYQSVKGSKKKVVGRKIIINKIDKKSLEAFVPYDKKGWVEIVGNIDGRRWQPEFARWVLSLIHI